MNHDPKEHTILLDWIKEADSKVQIVDLLEVYELIDEDVDDFLEGESKDDDRNVVCKRALESLNYRSDRYKCDHDFISAIKGMCFLSDHKEMMTNFYTKAIRLRERLLESREKEVNADSIKRKYDELGEERFAAWIMEICDKF
jgi:hypothetical protein